MTVTKIRQTKKTQAAASQEVGRRVSLGTAWETANENFFAGLLKEADAEYKNQSELLELVGQPAEGHQWRVKLFVRELKNGKTVIDAVLQEDPIYAR